MNLPEGPISLVALLGRRDEPTDGVEDYCVCLGQACSRRGVSFALVRVPWAERGWLGALRWLWRESAQWQGRCVIVQYTALAWSHRGFPLGLLPVLFLLRRRGVSIAVVFHDTAAYPGTRWVDRLRRIVQHSVMRRTFAETDRSILPMNTEHVNWLPREHDKAVFIPVGSNIPVPMDGKGRQANGHEAGRSPSKIIAVFGITPGRRGSQEMIEIREAVKGVAHSVPNLQLCVFGRGAKEAEPLLRQIFDGTGVELSVFGVLPAVQIGELLSRADVQMHVRNHISSQRGSVVAGIVCGTPVVGFALLETDAAIREAGVALAPPGDIRALAHAVARIVTDDVFRDEMCSRNRSATQKWFSWDAISDRILRALGRPL